MRCVEVSVDMVIIGDMVAFRTCCMTTHGDPHHFVRCHKKKKINRNIVYPFYPKQASISLITQHAKLEHGLDCM